MSDSPLISVLPRLRRLAAQKAGENATFRDYLKTRLPLSNAELDTTVQTLTDQVWAEISCVSCGNCCQTLQIVVDHKDASRLARRLGISLQAFTERYIAVTEDGTGVLKASPPCPFLGEDKHCTVYEDRPRACRDFPYLHERNVRSRSLILTESCGTCPIVYAVWEGLKERFPLPPSSPSSVPPPTRSGRRRR